MAAIVYSVVAAMFEVRYSTLIIRTHFTAIIVQILSTC